MLTAAGAKVLAGGLVPVENLLQPTRHAHVEKSKTPPGFWGGAMADLRPSTIR
jgi:hypothetical protein